MDAIVVLLLLAFIIKICDAAQFAGNSDWRRLVAQIGAWLIGIAVVSWVAQTEWGERIPVGGTALSRLGVWPLLLLGLCVGSLASVVHDATGWRRHRAIT